jgi:hypothetical protein
MGMVDVMDETDEMGAMDGMDEVEGGSSSHEGPGSSITSFTQHARRRGARRNVAPDAVDYVLAYGRMIQRTGAMFYFLGRRDIPPCDRRASWASRLEGSIVIVAPDGAVITIYRNRRGLHTIARKMKYQLGVRKQAPTRESESSATVMARASA